MNRREALKSLASVLPASMIPRVEQEGIEQIDGVGVLFFPSQEYDDGKGGVTRAIELAKHIGEHVKKGSIICLPSKRDDNGHLLWDFRVEGGDPKQVTVRRT